MLRTEEQVAVDEVARLGHRLAAAYDDAAEIAHDAEVARAFRALAAERAQLAELAARQVTSLGDVPSEPDRDREDVSRLVRRAKAALSHDERRSLVREREADEDRLAHALYEALALDLPDAIRAALAPWRERLANARHRLADLRVEA